jgi:hypothetical protein
VTSEDSPSKVTATEKPFSRFIYAEAVVSAAFCACAAPLKTNGAPGTIARQVCFRPITQDGPLIGC